jgi:hypothetical protein
MIDKGFKIIVFLTQHPECCKFPFTPEEVFDKSCTLNVIDYNGANTKDPFTIETYTHLDYKDENGLLNYVTGILSKDDRKTIFSVHPNAVLLPLYKWALMKNMDCSVDQYVNHVQRKCIDICEAFYRPTILSLDRRINFNCSDIQRWVGPAVNDKLTPNDNCFETLKKLCLKL